MSVKLTVALLFAVLAVGIAANILDYFDFENTKKLIDVPKLRNDPMNRNCMCKGSACVCCVNFNVTFVDLGGPGCVHMKYISPEEGFSVIVSYGKNLVHTSKIQGDNPQPVCLELFGWVAQICAKFDELAPTSDGLRGCLELQPKVMLQTQLNFPIGCFKSTPEGMEMDMNATAVAKPSYPEQEEEEEEESSSDTDTESFDTESFLLGVYQTAEQGVSFLSSLLDIPRNKTRTTTTPKPAEDQNTRRSSKNLKHPNRL